MGVTYQAHDTVSEERSPKGRPTIWRSIAETYATRILLIAIGLVTTVVVSRTLGPSGRGLFAVATAIAAIGVQFGNFGLHASNTYYVAKDRELLPVLIGNALIVGLGIGGMAALLGWFLAAMWPKLAPLHGTLLALALASIPFGLAYLLLQYLLLGIDQVRAFNGIELANKVIGLVLVSLVILLRRLSAELMFAATLVALVLCFLWVLWSLRGVFRHPVLFSITVFRKHIGLGIKAYLICFFGFLVLRIDLVMVKYMLGAQAAGYYSISETMAENMLTLPAVVGTILFPKLSRMAHNREKLQLTTKAAFVTAALMAPVMIVALLLAKPAVQLVFGKSFLPAVTPFIWLMPGSFLLGVETVIVQYLNSLGFPKIIAYFWLLVTALNIGINFWAIPAYGINGAAIVSTGSYSLIFVLVLAVIYNNNRSETAAVSHKVQSTIPSKGRLSAKC
jgi:O-antigen/teichoic acid export membrane protein